MRHRQRVWRSIGSSVPSLLLTSGSIIILLIANLSIMRPADAETVDTAPAATQATAAPDGPVAPVAPDAVTLRQPVVLNTARLRAGELIVNLDGIDGQDGDAAEEFRLYLHDQTLTCQPMPQDRFRCRLANGDDIALAALINGAALVRPDAPESYRLNQARAAVAHRGVWRSALRPPVLVVHPVVQNTATLIGEDHVTYELDGVRGIGAPFAGQLQAYIVQHGDGVICLSQANSGRFACSTADSTDIAKLALVNGAATVAADASDSYRSQQADAIDNRRGIWSGTFDLTACLPVKAPVVKAPVVNAPVVNAPAATQPAVNGMTTIQIHPSRQSGRSVATQH